MSQPDSDLFHWLLLGIITVPGGGFIYFLKRLHDRVEKHLDETNEVGGPQALVTLRRDFDAHEKMATIEHNDLRDELSKIRESVARLEPEVGRLKRIEDAVGGLNNTMLSLSSTVGTLSANVAMLLARPPRGRG